MSRYIDADALMDALNVFKDRKNGNEHFMYGIEAAKELLEIQPTVDAVPVCRCRKCKYAKGENFISAIWCENLEKYLAYDFFCHDGERRNDGK